MLGRATFAQEYGPTVVVRFISVKIIALRPFEAIPPSDPNAKCRNFRLRFCRKSSARGMNPLSPILEGWLLSMAQMLKCWLFGGNLSDLSREYISDS